jgi:hypothetical protein
MGQSGLLFRTPVGPAITALVGLAVVAACLLVFACDLLVITPLDFQALFVSFLICSLGAGIGFIVLRRLAPRREPISLFGGPGDVDVARPLPTHVQCKLNEADDRCAVSRHC